MTVLRPIDTRELNASLNALSATLSCLKAGLASSKRERMASAIPVFFNGRWRSVVALEGEQGLVLDEPLDGLSALELHRLGDCGGEVDIPLLGVFSFDKLDFGWESHVASSLVK